MSEEGRRPRTNPRSRSGAGGSNAGGGRRQAPARRSPQGADRRDERKRGSGAETGGPRGGRDEGRTASQAVYDGPPIPEEITGRELDRSVQAQLKSLPEKLGLRVARHLVAAGLLLAEDPKTAYEHTLAARARASRLAVVREAVGEAAYMAGLFSEALVELRAARRMNGSKHYVAMMADCERALGRPERALELLRGLDREDLDEEMAAEVTLVESGARRDRGEFDAALRLLENAHLNSKSRAPWVVRLRYAYADTLLDADRRDAALEWFHRAEAIDTDEITDAAERIKELEGA